MVMYSSAGCTANDARLPDSVSNVHIGIAMGLTSFRTPYAMNVPSRQRAERRAPGRIRFRGLQTDGRACWKTRGVSAGVYRDVPR